MKTIQFNSISKIITLLLISIFFVSCNLPGSHKENLRIDEVELSEAYKAVEQEEADAPTSSIRIGEIQTPRELKIIKFASARYKVADVQLATDRIKGIALNFDAYISELRFENNLYQKENRFTIKVPETYFDALMDSLGTVAEFVEYENISTQDVTEEYIDLNSRLATKLEVKARYEEILRNNARTVEDILHTEDKLRILQEEIEAAQGRLKYLTNKVAYSTIQVDLYETVEYTEEPSSYKKSFGAKTKNAFSFGWNLIQGTVLLVFHIWPLWLAGILLFLFLRFRSRR